MRFHSLRYRVGTEARTGDTRQRYITVTSADQRHATERAFGRTTIVGARGFEPPGHERDVYRDAPGVRGPVPT